MKGAPTARCMLAGLVALAPLLVSGCERRGCDSSVQGWFEVTVRAAQGPLPEDLVIQLQVPADGWVRLVELRELLEGTDSGPCYLDPSEDGAGVGAGGETAGGAGGSAGGAVAGAGGDGTAGGAATGGGGPALAAAVLCTWGYERTAAVFDAWANGYRPVHLELTAEEHGCHTEKVFAEGVLEPL